MSINTEQLQKKWREKGFSDQTPIQSKTYQPILEGEDLVAISPTGSGKTLAYVIPLLEKIQANHQLQVMIIAPSQELAQQIGEVIRDWKSSELTVQVLAGGANLKRQTEQLKKKPELIVGTPGRLLELANLKKLKLHLIQTVVLDEADYLLQQEARETVRALIKKCPSKRQMLCFSATKNPELEQVDKWINLTPNWIEVQQSSSEAKQVMHAYLETPIRKKEELLRKLANIESFQALVFVNSLANAGVLAEKLLYYHIPCAVLTSQAHQTQRKEALQAFKKKRVPLLLTTDVAARGIDVEDLPVVVHYDLPEHKEGYLHRSGRTGRMGKEGLVLSLVSEREVRSLKRLVPESVTLEKVQLHSGRLQKASASSQKTATNSRGKRWKTSNKKNKTGKSRLS